MNFCLFSRLYITHLKNKSEKSRKKLNKPSPSLLGRHKEDKIRSPRTLIFVSICSTHTTFSTRFSTKCQSFRQHIFPSPTLFLHPQVHLAEFSWSSLRVDSLPPALQSPIAMWLFQVLFNQSCLCVDLPSRCWPRVNYFLRGLLGSKVNKSISINSERGLEAASHSHIANRAHIT